jgi:hypothetical protein
MRLTITSSVVHVSLTMCRRCHELLVSTETRSDGVRLHSSRSLAYLGHRVGHLPIERSLSSYRSPNHLSTNQLLSTRNMSQSRHPTLTSTASSNFQSILDAALRNYKKKTKKDLFTHQLTAQLQTCKSPSDILNLLNKQYNVQELVQSQEGGESSKQWLNATVTVLCAFSGALGEGVGLVSLLNSSKIHPLIYTC